MASTSDAANEQNKQSHVETNTSDGDLISEGAGDQAWDNAKHALDSDDHATGDQTENGDDQPVHQPSTSTDQTNEPLPQPPASGTGTSDQSQSGQGA